MPEEKVNQARYFEDPQPTREISLITHRTFIKKKLLDILKEALLSTIPKKMLNKEGKSVIELRLN